MISHVINYNQEVEGVNLRSTQRLFVVFMIIQLHLLHHTRFDSIVGMYVMLTCLLMFVDDNF